jgi:PAS domain S-box-containing protein
MQRDEFLRRIFWISGALAAFVLVYVLSVLFLNPSSVGNTGFVWKLNLWAVVWAVNFILISILLFILARDLIKLFFEYQANRPGSRIKTKLALTLIIFSLFPALCTLFLAFGLLNRNLRQWFSSPAEQLLGSSRVIAAKYYQQQELFVLSAAATLAGPSKSRNGGGGALPELSLEARRQGFTDLLVVDGDLRRLSRTGNWPADFPSPSLLAEVAGGRVYYRLDRNQEPPILAPGSTRLDRGVAGVPWDAGEGRRGALFLRFLLPESVTFHALQIEDAVRKYQAVKARAGDFQTNYFAILVFTALSMMAGFLWLGGYIARRITVPLEALAEGSRRLAGGNLDYRVGVRAVDELGILVESFNRMAEQLKESRVKLEQANDDLRETNVRLEERRAYIETVLQNIATGVVSVDESDIIRTVNEAASKMLRTNRERMLGRSLKEIAESDLYVEFQRMKKRARLYGTYRNEIALKRDGRELHIAATITANPLPGMNGAEYLVVLDDLTELIRSEKFAAWQEVARRLAHEIKNPLTPIQLSAERVAKRFERISAAGGLGSELNDFGRLLKEAVRVIVAESEMLKSLVHEFSSFARLPISKPTEVHLHSLIEDTLSSYAGAWARVSVCKQLDPAVGLVKLDAEQMRRVFVNLLDNALDALAEQEEEQKIVIVTRLNEVRQTVTIEFQDTGGGIQPDDYEHLFLPYFSTKRKGTGLGLAIVRQIVSEHSGHVRAESNSPQGTRMIMELPIGGVELEQAASGSGYGESQAAGR